MTPFSINGRSLGRVRSYDIEESRAKYPEPRSTPSYAYPITWRISSAFDGPGFPEDELFQEIARVKIGQKIDRIEKMLIRNGIDPVTGKVLE